MKKQEPLVEYDSETGLWRATHRGKQALGITRIRALWAVIALAQTEEEALCARMQ